jgi:hypothetical protein
MPNLHESVTSCERCDHYVAVIEVFPCAQCGKPMCPGCAQPTNDPDLSVCSHLCGAKFSKRLKNEAA